MFAIHVAANDGQIELIADLEAVSLTLSCLRNGDTVGNANDLTTQQMVDWNAGRTGSIDYKRLKIQAHLVKSHGNLLVYDNVINHFGLPDKHWHCTCKLCQYKNQNPLPRYHAHAQNKYSSQ